MATQGVVIADATEATPTIGNLFQGKCFLVQQRVPQRNSFLERIRANGGRIVRLELQADYIIADHLRKDSPPTSLSYTFVEAAIRDGALPDPDDHRAGPAAGAIRAIGSSTVPAKATRTPFTPQDDRDVCNWVLKCQQEGQFIKGYEIYKQLEAINPRHTFQSWRDRFLKKLMNNLPQGVAALQTPTLQPPPTQAPAPRISNVDGAAESRTLADGEDEQSQRDRGGQGAHAPSAAQQRAAVQFASPNDLMPFARASSPSTARMVGLIACELIWMKCFPLTASSWLVTGSVSRKLIFTAGSSAT